MASFSRPVQYSLAIADLAKHLGGPELIESLDKPALKELIQVMGILGTETAMALLPKLDHSMTLWKTEKIRIRNEVLRGVKPPSLQVGLRDSPLFTESLFPEKVFREQDLKCMESDPTNYFPHFVPSGPASGPFKRPLPPQGVDPSARKRGKMAHPPAPAKNPRQERKNTPSTSYQGNNQRQGGKPQGGNKAQGGSRVQGGNKPNAPNLKKALAAATSSHRPFQANKQQHQQHRQQQQQQANSKASKYAKQSSNTNK